MSDSAGISNCIRCGRDTQSKDGVCGPCLTGRPSYVRLHGEMRGRTARGHETVEDLQDDDETSDTRYHGDNYEP
jgi:hypothetical protein